MIKEIFGRVNRVKLAALGSLLLTIIIIEIVMTCLIPTWRSYFYNILQAKDENLFITSLIYFFLLMTGLGAAQGLKVWVGQLLSFEVRQQATKLLLKTWVYANKKVNNYTQAMTEALRNSTELYLEIVVEVVISMSIVVLLLIANLHNVPILIASLAYTAIASLLAILFNRPLISSDFEWQSAEGRFREAIGDIANGNGDYSSKGKFLVLVESYYRYIRIVMVFTLFSRVKSSLSSIVPYVILATPYFSGEISLGDFMSGVAVFELIVINSTILIMLYPKLTKARASYLLSKEFYSHITKKGS